VTYSPDWRAETIRRLEAGEAMLAALQYTRSLFASGVLKENDNPWYGTMKRMTYEAIAQAEAAGIKVSS
jgi:hypothetical protein